MKRMQLLSMLLLGLIAGCAGPDGIDRAHHLMQLAASEAKEVDAPVGRLKRQLNIAFMQINADRSQDGRTTLAQAVETLQNTGDQLPEQTRIAGWISISELSRQCGDLPRARMACDQALKRLQAIEPPWARCDYVRGVAIEIRWLQGKPAALALLRESGQWAVQIQDIAYRRLALTAIASDLFDYDDFDGGHGVIRRERDASWRSDTLANLAKNNMHTWSFGKSVSYESNFGQK